MEGRNHFHSIIKSIRGRVIFYTDSDRLLFLLILRRFIEKHSIVLVEFVLMANHVHLLHTASSRQHAMLFVSELQQNYSYWYNRFHSSHDKFFVPAKIYPKYTMEYVVRCSHYILQNPMVASVQEYPHPGNYKWSSYHFHYNFMDESGMLVRKPLEVLKTNRMAGLINSSRSVLKNRCPALLDNFTWPHILLSDIIEVNVFDHDRLYTKEEFAVIVQKCIVSPKEEYASERLEASKEYLRRHKESLSNLVDRLRRLLTGREYGALPRDRQIKIIETLLSDTRATPHQLSMLLDEDKNFIKEIQLKIKK